MRYDEIENIWTVDLGDLSNADRGRLFFERAKQVVTRVLADPAAHPKAMRGNTFNRGYLTSEIGAQPAVTTQNPRIRELLEQADERLGRLPGGRPTPGGRSPQVVELQATVDALRRLTQVQAAEISELKRKLRESDWSATDLAGHGRLPW